MKADKVISIRSARDELVSRIEVLDKVKSLVMIPDMEMVTTRQLADYYDAPLQTVKQAVKRNHEEFEQDGMIVLTSTEFENQSLWVHYVPTDKKASHGGMISYSVGDVEVQVSTRSTGFFPRRAVLRMGMLLRDSEVAKEVRSALLNAAEQIPPKKVIEDAEKEKKLLYSIAMAYGKGSLADLMTACHELNVYQTERIQSLQKVNSILSGKILEYGDRQKLNAAVRVLAAHMGTPTAYVFSSLYRQLDYKFGISLAKRRGRSNSEKFLLSFLKESEYPKAFQSIYAIAEKNGIAFDLLEEKSGIPAPVHSAPEPEKKEYTDYQLLLKEINE